MPTLSLSLSLSRPSLPIFVFILIVLLNIINLYINVKNVTLMMDFSGGTKEEVPEFLQRTVLCH
jgi:hypothetical protein